MAIRLKIDSLFLFRKVVVLPYKIIDIRIKVGYYDGMETLKNIIDREISVYTDMLDEYMRILSQLPKGSLFTKTIRNHQYYYIRYREGKKVKTDYIGKNELVVVSVQEKLLYRKHIEEMMKKVSQQIKEYNKVAKTI